jgi:hypothetical protein
VHWLRKGRLRNSVIFGACAALFGTWYGLAVYGGYHHPLFLEGILVGRTHLDQLDVVATTNMIRTYGMPSTGLDGIPYCHYHWLSWWILAQISKVLNTDAITAVHLGYPVIFIPWLLNTMFVFAIDVRRRLAYNSHSCPLRGELLFWLLPAVAIIGFVPKSLTSLMMLGIPSSESYAVSLSLGFVLLSLALRVFERTCASTVSLSKADQVFLLVVLPAYLCIVTLTKVSTGFLACVAYAYVAVRLNLYTKPLFALSLMLGLAAAIVGLKSGLEPTNVGGRTTLFEPFHFLRHHVDSSVWPYFLVVHLFWSGLFLATVARLRNLTSVESFKTAFRDRSCLDAELLVVVCIAGILPGVVLAIGGGSAWYFSHVQAWVAIALLMGYSGEIRPRLVSFYEGRSAARSSGGIILARRLLAVFVVVFMAGLVAYHGVQTVAYALYRNVSLRLCLCTSAVVQSNAEIGCDGKAWIRELSDGLKEWLLPRGKGSLYRIACERILPLITDVQRGLELGPNFPIIRALKELGGLPLAEKRQSMIFIPQKNTAYWFLIPPDFLFAYDYPGCEAVPFISPVITGIASIDGLPDVGCETYAFNYPAYPKRSRPQVPADTAPDVLCAKAKDKGFSRVYVVGGEGSDPAAVTRILCSDRPSNHK